MNINYKRIYLGLISTINSKAKKICLGILALIITLIGICLYFAICKYVQFIDIAKFKSIYIICFVILGVFAELSLIYMFTHPIKAIQVEKLLYANDIVNKYKETPMLIGYKNKNGVQEYRFYCEGITLSEMKDKKEKIENSLNSFIVGDIEFGDEGSRNIILKTVKARKLPKVIEWHKSFLPKASTLFSLGVAYDGEKFFDFDNYSHLIIGGSTNSGKTTFSKSILMQAVLKGWQVYIVDFKGGLDYPNQWHDYTHIYTNKEDLLDLLKTLEAFKDIRKEEFVKNGVKDIEAYNKIASKPLKHIILFIDEIAMVLNKSGISKDDKETVLQIEHYLSDIAGVYRAFGFHLIVCTQRPDATIIPPLVRSNIDYRICGRADKILSEIILDKPDASVRVRKSDRGMFLTSDDVLFKSYLVKNSDLESGDAYG